VVKSITQAQVLWHKSPKFHPYQKGNKVWLEGMNRHTSHPTHKLHPKQFGPFEVTEALSLMTFRLDLPLMWKLHNTFHASLLTPYRKTLEHGANYPTPAPELIDGEPKWEIEEILVSYHHG
jgi:hypothetical protein